MATGRPRYPGSSTFYRVLGTPERDKRLVITDSGHSVPRNEPIRETLGWLDRYLGPVK